MDKEVERQLQELRLRLENAERKIKSQDERIKQLEKEKK